MNNELIGLVQERVEKNREECEKLLSFMIIDSMDKYSLMLMVQRGETFDSPSDLDDEELIDEIVNYYEDFNTCEMSNQLVIGYFDSLVFKLTSVK